MKAERFKLLFFVIGLVVLLAPALSLGAKAPAIPEVMFILDGSGSMWGDAGGQKKIVAARAVLVEIVPKLPEEVKIGLTAYGHRRKGDCNDVQVIAETGGMTRKRLLSKIRAIQPKGKTPIAGSIKLVADKLKTKENETTIVLISDGLETCHDDPCGVVKALKSAGLKFVLHVVGFDVDAKGKKQLGCLAEAGGGQYYSAGDAASLTAALEKVRAQVETKVKAAKSKKVKKKTKLGKLKLTMPKSSLRTTGEVHIVRAKDGKVIKKAKPAASKTHPLLAGEYKLVLAMSNSNYQPPSMAPAGEFTIVGGETTEINLGAIVLNRAKGLGDAAHTVILIDEGTGKTFVGNFAKGNDYYLWKTKPAPAGSYTLALHYARSEKPAVVVTGIRVQAGKEAVVTLDSGIALKKGGDVVGWDLHPAGSDKPIMEIRRRSDNDYPIWKQFPALPGSYDLYVHLRGMDEPLPVGEGIEIKAGETTVFDPELD